MGREEEEEDLRDAGGRDAMVGIDGGGGGRDRSSIMLEMRDAAVSATRAIALRDAVNFEDQLRPLVRRDLVAPLFVCAAVEGGQGGHIPAYG